MSFHTIRMFPVAMLAAALALPAGPAQAQTIGQSACPDGVTEKKVLSLFFVNGVTHDRVTFRGAAPISTTDINELSDVTGDWPGDWNNAILYFGVRGYGYPDGVQDARKVPFTDGDLVHGVWLHVGKVTFRGLIPSPATLLSLEPSTKYVAQLVVGELRTRDGRNVTNEFVSGVANPNKPKPVLAQACFETAASPS